MKRVTTFVFFFIILGSAVGAMYWSQRHAKAAAVSPSAVLQMAADAQRDLSRVPMQFTRISDEQEIALGNQFAARYTEQSQGLSAEERGLEAYVGKIGITLAARAHRRLPYSFHLVPDHNLINAFSLPGGPVFIGEGMLELMDTEDELASVLSHEIEHIDHYHCVERFQIEAKLRKLDLAVVGDLLQIPMDFWRAGYQKDQEFEADREGLYLAVKSGYSPYGAVDLFSRFSKLQGEQTVQAVDPAAELSRLAQASLAGYFRSHPLSSERLAQANILISEEHWEIRTEQRKFHVEYQVHNGQYMK